MLNDATSFKHIYIVCGFTDLMSGIDTLVSIINKALICAKLCIYSVDAKLTEQEQHIFFK